MAERIGWMDGAVETTRASYVITLPLFGKDIEKEARKTKKVFGSVMTCSKGKHVSLSEEG